MRCPLSDTPHTFENPYVQLQVEKQPGCKVIFTITARPIAAEAARQKALKSVSKEVNIPGFRKGKAPRNLISERFAAQVEDEFRDVLVRNSLNEAIRLSQTAPHSKKTPIKLVKFEELDAGAYLVAIEFEAFPDVPSVDPTHLSLKSVETKPVEATEIQKRIEDLRLHHASWEVVEERGAEIEDFVTLDIDAIDETPAALHRDSRFHLREGKIPHWAKELILGMKVGESREGFSAPDAEDDPERFKSRQCKFILKKIERAILPPLDEALCKKAGADNVATLEERIGKSLAKEHENEARRSMRQAIKSALLEQYPFETPGERLNHLHRECHEISDQEKDRLKSDAEREAYAHHLFEEGKKNIQLSFLLPKIAREHHIQFPSVEEIRQRSTEHLIMRYMAGEKEMGDEEVARFSEIAENELLTEKIFDFLIEKAKRA